MSVHDTRQVFVEVLCDFLPEVSSGDELQMDASLRGLGLNSLRAVDLLIALEDRFGVMFPDEALTDETFATADALLAMLVTLQEAMAHG